MELNRLIPGLRCAQQRTTLLTTLYYQSSRIGASLEPDGRYSQRALHRCRILVRGGLVVPTKAAFDLSGSYFFTVTATIAVAEPPAPVQVIE